MKTSILVRRDEAVKTGDINILVTIFGRNFQYYLRTSLSGGV